MNSNVSQFELIFERQWLHVLFLVGLLAGLVLASGIDGFQRGSFLGLSTMLWFWLAVGFAVVHQTTVWFCWRTQLHLSLLTRAFGDNGFTLYAVLFSILGISRVLTVFILAISNRGTFALDLTTLRILALFMAIPALYLFYSVKRYFGLKRAFGIDHFDASYRTMPFVNKGIFRFTSNGMYIFGFFLLWIPGLWCASIAGLFASLFNHLYIWVHYYSTELPDIRRIYG